MQLKRAERDSLTLWLGQYVAGARVSKFGVMSSDDVKESIAPEIKEKLEKASDRDGFIGLIEKKLHRRILKTHNITESRSVLVTSLDGFSDTLKIARDLTAEFEALPVEYLLLVRAPAALASTVRSLELDVKLSDRFGLISSSLIQNRVKFGDLKNPEVSHIWRQNKIENRYLAKSHLYFYYHAKGFISETYQSSHFGEFMNEIRAFYGVCLAHEILFAYEERQDVRPILLAIDKATEFVDEVGNFDSDLIEATYFDSSDKVKTRYLKSSNFLRLISPIVEFFACNSPRLKTASIWLLRAMVSNREMDRILESAIALEVLLGDRAMSDKVGLTRLMSNRCAYSLAKSAKERDHYQKFFNRFYAARSDIVHKGYFDSSGGNERLAWEALDLSRRMLVYEQSIEACSDEPVVFGDDIPF